MIIMGGLFSPFCYMSVQFKDTKLDPQDAVSQYSVDGLQFLLKYVAAVLFTISRSENVKRIWPSWISALLLKPYVSVTLPNMHLYTSMCLRVTCSITQS